jgi:hypothetical protein
MIEIWPEGVFPTLLEIIKLDELANQRRLK